MSFALSIQPMIFGLGLPELAIILVIVLLIFGAPAIPKLAKSIGSTIKEIRNATSEDNKEEPKNNGDKTV